MQFQWRLWELELLIERVANASKEAVQAGLGPRVKLVVEKESL